MQPPMPDFLFHIANISNGIYFDYFAKIEFFFDICRNLKLKRNVS